MEELLTCPTTSSITISVMTETNAEMYVEYGTNPGDLTESSPTILGLAGIRTDHKLEGLEAGTKYYYRMRYKHELAPRFQRRPEYSFWTAREEGDTVRFAFFSDSHLFKNWAAADCGRADLPQYTLFKETVDNILAADVDFVLTTGDEVMTHCYDCNPCIVNGVSTGENTIGTLSEAEARYQVYINELGELKKRLPFFYVLGNHDGEGSFSHESGICDRYDTTDSMSEAARLKYMPNPASVYTGGSPTGNFYSFATGDLELFFLDNFKHTGPTFPLSPQDWSLGAAQSYWLFTNLHLSAKRWKFLAAHHLFGGQPEWFGCYHYGRGGLKATEDGTIRGNFLGEQAMIHGLMKLYGAQVFLSGHDHLAIAGEKLDTEGNGEGVHYVMGPQPCSTPSAWHNSESFQDAMDWNEDGVADYLEVPPTSATTNKGFFLVTIVGSDAALFHFITTNPDDPESSNTPTFTYSVPLDSDD